MPGKVRKAKRGTFYLLFQATDRIPREKIDLRKYISVVSAINKVIKDFVDFREKEVEELNKETEELNRKQRELQKRLLESQMKKDEEEKGKVEAELKLCELERTEMAKPHNKKIEEKYLKWAKEEVEVNFDREAFNWLKKEMEEDFGKIFPTPDLQVGLMEICELLEIN